MGASQTFSSATAILNRRPCQMLLFLQLIVAVAGSQPYFGHPFGNVTVAQGRDVTLNCVVNNVGRYKIAWIRADSKRILTIHKHMVTDNTRMSISHDFNNTWALNIRSVRLQDSGQYMCQVNTDPVIMQTIFLEVVFPPEIIYEETSGDKMVVEGGYVKLVCKARGFPKPRIVWTREDGKSIVTHDESSGLTERTQSVNGEILTLTKVTNCEMGVYVCTAANGIPPSVSKQMMLHVHCPIQRVK